MGREIRRVPELWNHPKRQDGGYIPLFDGSFDEAEAEWNLGHAKWQEGLVENYGDGDKWKPIEDQYSDMQYTEYCGARPSPDEYMPVFVEEDCTHIMMYETCTEGTPISPSFKTPEELARWLTDNGASSFGHCTATYEQWLATAKCGYAVSAVMTSGVIMSGVEANEAIK